MKTLKQFEDACKAIAEDFRASYYSPEDEIYYVAADVTGVFEICDTFTSINHAYEFLKYNYTVEEYCRYLEYSEAGGKVCIRDFKRGVR